jgi:hypothetical protein
MRFQIDKPVSHCAKRSVRRLQLLLVVGILSLSGHGAPKYGPASALEFSLRFRGASYDPGEEVCYPEAKGIPLSDLENIIPMSAQLWTPQQLAEDFRERAKRDPRKKGILVLLKTERCAINKFRLCTVATAAIEKRSTPLLEEFVAYGVWLLPRDDDNPSGSSEIESGENAWKNEAAGLYNFKQGPGATIALIDPIGAKILKITDAVKLRLYEKDFIKNEGRTPLLESELRKVLEILSTESAARVRP